MEALDATLAPVQIRIEDDLGIAVGAEHQSRCAKFGADFGEVVDLAIEDDLQPSLGDRHRLLSTAQVDDGETPVSERCVLIDVDARFIRPAMEKRIAHRANAPPCHGLVMPGEIDETRDAAHAGLLRRGDWQFADDARRIARHDHLVWRGMDDHRSGRHDGS